MSRISLDPPRTPFIRLAEWYARRRFGRVPDPGRAIGHHPKVLMSYARFEQGVEKWHALDPGLGHLAVMASAVRIGCSWCVDFGHWKAEGLGLPMEKVGKVPVWREHREDFTELEQWVMEYAEAMSETEPSVTDDLARRLLDRLGEAAFVELTAMVAVENLRSRLNSALGLTSQGFSEWCAVPPRTS
ncbi:carboxymuconolactone decarboxylase family protein [Streptomyces sp. NPDC059718]